jgi:hypothetical protein
MSTQVHTLYLSFATATSTFFIKTVATQIHKASHGLLRKEENKRKEKCTKFAKVEITQKQFATNKQKVASTSYTLLPPTVLPQD